MRNRSRNILNRTLEGVVAIVLVLFFFTLLIMVFNRIFPEGSGLQFIFAPPEQADKEQQQDSDLIIARGNQSDSLQADDSWSATLVSTRNSVKSKKADDIAWQKARKGMRLYNLDAVQTLEDSSATIKFDDKNLLDLGDSSLIVIRRMERDLLFKEKRSFMVVVDGELRGRISGDGQDGVYLEVTTPNAVARLQSNPDNDRGIEFKIEVEEDSASAVTVYSGEAEVEAKGETVILVENQLSRVIGEEAPTAPVRLPAPVTLQKPFNSEIFPYRSLPPRIALTWKKQAEATAYHLLLANDAEFTDILIDKKTSENSFVHGNLHEGRYYWKVSAINQAGEGAFTSGRDFSLIVDKDPPPLTVNFPPEVIRQPFAAISGNTEQQARLYIDGKEVNLDKDGSFRHQLPLKRGINVVVIEAVDAAGNISYDSRLINGKY